MKKFTYDLFIIGAGSGGIRAARVATRLGAKVAIAESEQPGGTCVNVGCVPKKLFFYAADFANDFLRSKEFGWTLDGIDFNWQRLIGNKNKEISRLNNVYIELLRNANIDMIEGYASLIDPHTVMVNDKHYSCKRILIATGSRPDIPELPGRQYILSSNEMFFLEKLPETMVIVGGGYIAVEFAGIFNALGVKITLLNRGPELLRGFDQDIREFMAQEMQKKGIQIKFTSEIGGIKKQDDKLHATLKDQSTLIADQIMYATGRKPRVDGFGLESLGVGLDESSAIVVNRQYQTNIPSIYAIGDVTNHGNLTPVALAEGTILAESLYNNGNGMLSYENIPTCIFGIPNAATVGLDEEAARKRYRYCEIYKTTFVPMRNSLSDSNEQTLMKLIVDKETDRVIGAHMVGHGAGEIIQGIGIAIKAGAKKADFDQTLGIHPTTAEEFVSMPPAQKI